MTALEDIYIVAGARTAIGDFGGSLKSFTPAELGALVITEAMSRAGVSPDEVEHVVLGQVMVNGPEDEGTSRVAALKAGIPHGVPALNVNRLCGSGVQAIVSCAQMMKLGEASITVAGGAESMSNVPFYDKSSRWGARMGNITLIDGLTAGLSDPLDGYHMGVTAENVAERHCVTRADMDALSVTSHARSTKAIAEGRFKEQIVPVEVKTRKGTTVFDTDEHPRADTSMETLGAMRPAFKKDGGTVTAGNASGINDGAAAVVLATASEVTKRGLKPLAKIVAWGHAGVEPAYMGEGPIKAVPIALSRAGLSLDQMDVIESNEAFAAQAAAVAKVLGFDPEKVNPNGSGVSLGHPVGATGCILTLKAAYELKRIGGKYALITMCIGGGQGIAMVIENAQ